MMAERGHRYHGDMRLPALLAALVVTALPAAATDAPSFDCGRAEAGSIEARVCGSKELSALDRQMTSVYAAARAKAKNEHPPTLAAEQRGWIKAKEMTCAERP